MTYEAGKELYSLETGYRSTGAGAIVSTVDGRLLWLISGPVTSVVKGAFHLYRAELRESRDGGLTWSEPRPILRSTSEYAELPMTMLRLSSGKILLFLGRYGGYSPDHDPNKSRLDGYTMISEDNGDTWSEAAELPTGERYLSSTLQATQMKNGRIVYPFGYLTDNNGCFVVGVVYSDDESKSWRRSQSVLETAGDGFESGACEPSVVELDDGRLWMLIRTQSGCQWESFSSDGGETWSEPAATNLPSSNSPAVQLKLASGLIVVAWNNTVITPYGRYNLVLAGTYDAKNFFGFREIYHTDYPMNSTQTYWGVMYPFLTERPDGKILVPFTVGDWVYCSAMLATIDPNWLDEKKQIEDFSHGLSAWSCLGEAGAPFNRSVSLCVADDEGADDCTQGAAMQVEYKEDGPSGAVRNFPAIVNGKISLLATIPEAGKKDESKVIRPDGSILEQAHVSDPGACLLFHNSFPAPGEIDNACLRVRFDASGSVFLGGGVVSTEEFKQNGVMVKYNYPRYVIDDEIRYPQTIKLGKRFAMDIELRVDFGVAVISVDGDAGLEVKLPDVSQLSYFGIASTNGGAIRLRRVVFDSQEK